MPCVCVTMRNYVLRFFRDVSGSLLSFDICIPGRDQEVFFSYEEAVGKGFVGGSDLQL